MGVMAIKLQSVCLVPADDLIDCVDWGSRAGRWPYPSPHAEQGALIMRSTNLRPLKASQEGLSMLVCRSGLVQQALRCRVWRRGMATQAQSTSTDLLLYTGALKAHRGCCFAGRSIAPPRSGIAQHSLCKRLLQLIH